MRSIAIYARVSSEQQAQEATIDSQVAALKERVAADGHVLLPQDVYLDDGFSGSTLVRPALERLRDRVAEGGRRPIVCAQPRPTGAQVRLPGAAARRAAQAGRDDRLPQRPFGQDGRGRAVGAGAGHDRGVRARQDSGEVTTRQDPSRTAR